ncbi:MAG: hypothetical protein L0099_03180, partial [Acidobacteria bacterium]|nr:hypothetical protein [Acidobacteriota bacterium]
MITATFAAVALAGAGAAFAQPSITNLGTLPGAEASFAAGVSGDGSVVVGDSYTTPSRAFRWASAAGMQDVGT